jgi:hypothetical protein
MDKLAVPVHFLYTTSMKKIEKIFNRCGFRHEQLQRNGDVAIFKRVQIGCSTSHYEVVRFCSHKGYKMGNSYIESAETYPGSSLWGIRGWTYINIESARNKYGELVKKYAGKTKVPA